MIKVVNVVASGQLDRQFDTAELADTTSLPIKKKAQDGRVYFDLSSVEATISLSRTGQYLVSGATNLETVYETRGALLDVLKGIGIEIETESIEDPEVSNIVFSGKLEQADTGVDLVNLVEDLGLDKASYEPKPFPQIVYRPDGLDCVILIFSSGKVNVTGCEEFETGDEAMELIQSKIQTK